MKKVFHFCLMCLVISFLSCNYETPDTPNKEDQTTTKPDTPTIPTPENGEENGYAYVDLGLSVKWATCNVGATKPEEYGKYFAWGEIVSKEYYDWSTYKWCNGSQTTLTKYCIDADYGQIDNKTTLEPSDDVATAQWGGSWRMPNVEEMNELCEKCTWRWTTENGVQGYIVTSKNGNSIFLPAAGSMYNTSLIDLNKSGEYWTSTLYPTITFGAYLLKFHSTSVFTRGTHRSTGPAIRAVHP